MPETRSLITSTFFINLINRLGVRPPPPTGFEISNTVVPVSIVDQDVTLNAVATSITCDTPFTAGPLVAPGAGTILADTGAQNAGNYNLLFVIYANENTANGFTIRRRNAANAADIWNQLISGGFVNGQASWFQNMRIVLNQGERFRIENIGAGTAGITYQASIWLVPG